LFERLIPGASKKMASQMKMGPGFRVGLRRKGGSMW